MTIIEQLEAVDENTCYALPYSTEMLCKRAALVIRAMGGLMQDVVTDCKGIVNPGFYDLAVQSLELAGMKVGEMPDLPEGTAAIVADGKVIGKITGL